MANSAAVGTRLVGMQYGTILQSGWRGFARNAWVLVGFSVGYGVVAAAVSALAYAAGQKLVGPELQPLYLLALIPLLLLKVVVHLLGAVALVNGALMAAKGQTFPIQRLFSEASQIFNLLGLQVFAILAILLGLLAFQIPGIYLAVAYWFAAFVLVDQRRSFLDAMASARALVTPHWFDVAALLLVITAISAAGALLLGVGLFATVPLALCVGAAGYLQLANPQR
jgi:hypothetical protein